MKQKRLGPINQQKSQGPTSDPKTANRQAITKAPFYKGACAPVACPANSAGNAPWFGENHPTKNGKGRGWSLSKSWWFFFGDLEFPAKKPMGSFPLGVGFPEVYTYWHWVGG